MTNSEPIIVDLKGIANILIREDLCNITPIEKAIESLKENDKLKAEIEKLKAELEQSVKLPCKVGDVVYRVNGKIIPMKIDSILIKHRNENAWFRIDCIEKEFKGEFSFICDNVTNNIGKRMFLTLEEAEQALKGKVE